jgi:hypothetical protein
MTNTIRPCGATSQLIRGEVQTGYTGRTLQCGFRKPVTLGGQRKSDGGARRVVGGRMHGKVRHVKEGDLSGTRLVFTAPKQGRKSQPGRSQSIRSSVDAG